MAYNPNIPNPGDFLSDSQVDIKANFGALNTAFGIDHTPFTGVTNAGFHKPVHLISGGIPAAVAGTTIVCGVSVTPNTSPGSAADTQLFSRTASGVISQLTGYIAENEGYYWSGGILVQWGRVAISSGTGSDGTHKFGSVSFQARNAGKTIPFPFFIFGVSPTLTAINTGITTASNSIAIVNQSLTGFDWVFNSSSSSADTNFPTFFWTAIGK